MRNTARERRFALCILATGETRHGLSLREAAETAGLDESDVAWALDEHGQAEADEFVISEEE